MWSGRHTFAGGASRRLVPARKWSRVVVACVPATLGSTAGKQVQRVQHSGAATKRWGVRLHRRPCALELRVRVRQWSGTGSLFCVERLESHSGSLESVCR